MEETQVRLLCPECNKNWRSDPTELPATDENFHCPNCHASRRLSEFLRTEHDLRTVKQLG
jgi:ssDNA-binding Zn-finger/Zn-ribbon topoisomerase 1